MDQSCHDIFSRPAFPSDQDRNIRGSYFTQPRANRLHNFRVSKDDVVGGNLAKRLRQRSDRKCRHKIDCPIAEVNIRMH